MSVARWIGHACGGAGAAVVVLFALGFVFPPAGTFPDSRWLAFHAFFVGAFHDRDDLPAEHRPGWREEVEPGDVIFVSRGQVTWGRWSHAAVVVRAPEGDPWVAAGTLAVVDASIHDGVYLSPLERYASWPRVAVRRASDDPEVRLRIADRALTHRSRIFASVFAPGGPYTNCTAVAVDAIRAAGLDAALTGWGVPDELLESSVWRR